MAVGNVIFPFLAYFDKSPDMVTIIHYITFKNVQTTNMFTGVSDSGMPNIIELGKKTK